MMNEGEEGGGCDGINVTRACWHAIVLDLASPAYRIPNLYFLTLSFFHY